MDGLKGEGRREEGRWMEEDGERREKECKSVGYYMALWHYD